MKIGSQISLIKSLFVGITIIMLLVSSSKAIADQVVVVKVIEKRQEKRKSTRWTLTEWLKIKERMKMMDVWLAMFSPKKPEFTPELNLNYKSIIANYSNEDYEAVLNPETSYGASMWLTNIVSASTGIRTLNIDLGFSTQTSVSDNGFNLAIKDGSLASSVSDEFTPFSTKVGVDLRILGSHSQDTSLVYNYSSERGNSQVGYDEGGNVTEIDYLGTSQSLLFKVYLLSWLGFEADYSLMDGKASNQLTEYDIAKTESKYGGFIEVSLLRFEYFVFEKETDYGNDQVFKVDGYMTGLTLQI